MTGPQLTALSIVVLGTIAFGATFYPGVRRQGASPRNSFWAALMAALLCAVALGLFAGALHHGLGDLWAQIVG